MRILILGGTGMLGHRLWLACRERHETYVAVRGSLAQSPGATIFDRERVVEGMIAADFDSVLGALAVARPDVVVNSIGIVKQRPAAHDPVASLTVNSLFPHRLARACRVGGSRLIHLSTDCVFSGRRGHYAESDLPDPEDLYGRSKLLGEVTEDHCLTLRTSMIGRELAGSQGLVEWFLGQQGRVVQGYTQAIFSGLTTAALAALVVEIIERYPRLSGLRHVASAPISKYDLLRLIRLALSLDVKIEPADAVQIDRSLDDRQFRKETKIDSPDWPTMIEELARDELPYDTIRRNQC